MKTRFPWRAWHWTNAEESLFDLGAEELAIFKEFCTLASHP
jgi:hypothetical protein